MSSRRAKGARLPRAICVRTRWAASCSVALWSSGCRIDRFETEATSVATASQNLAITREPETPPPLGHAHVELSEFAVEHFVELELSVYVTSGQGLERQGLLAYWLGDVEAQPVRESFGGTLANSLVSHQVLTTVPCSTVPCRLTLELMPRGEWASDVSFPIQYEITATLELERRERLALDSDLTLSLELAP